MSNKQRWAAEAATKLVGRTIKSVRYMTSAEVEEMGWYRASLVITLDDGAQLFMSADDEGNDAGAMFTTYADLQVIPVI